MYALNHFYANVFDELGVNLATGIQIHIFGVDDKAASTVYSDKIKTSKTNPITTAVFATDGGVIEFWGAAATYDVLIVDDEGNCRFVPDFSHSQHHRIVLDKSSVLKHMVVPLSFNDNSETDSGVDLIEGSWIVDAALEVVDIDATETVDAGTLTGGTNADPNGLLAATAVGVAGFVALAGSDATTYGAFLIKADQSGSNVKSGHHIASGDELSITSTGSAGSDTFTGYLHILYVLLR